jgi:hypothetical protein
MCRNVIEFPFGAIRAAVEQSQSFPPSVTGSIPEVHVGSDLVSHYMLDRMLRGVSVGASDAAAMAIVVSVVMAGVCIFLQRGRIFGWILGLIGVAVSLCAWPLGQWAIKLMVTVYGIKLR